MFRNPVYDLIVIVPALLIAGLLGFFIMTSAAHAQTVDPLPVAQATTTGMAAVTASTSGNTLPDSTQKILIVTRTNTDTPPTPAAPASPLGVRTSADLLAYARAALVQDPYIESITLSGRSIVVAYERQGRLLGILPLAVPTTATVRTDGSVSFTAPWYGSVTVADRDRMKSALEVRVHALLTSEGYLASMSLAPSTQAEILDIIRELLA
jgi:hypothetical protein